MPYLFIENFEAGLDTRKSRFTAPPGSLRQCVNAHVTRGKEIEKRKAFSQRSVIVNTLEGLYGAGDRLYMFSSDSVAPIPEGVELYITDTPGNSALDPRRLWSAQVFGDKVYAVVEDFSGRIRHFYDEALVTDWEAIATSLGSEETVARALVERTLRAPGFVVTRQGVVITYRALKPEPSGSTGRVTVRLGGLNTGDMTVAQTQANVPPSDGVNATAEFTVTGGSADPGGNQITLVSLDGFDLIGSPVDHTGSDDTTAQEVVDRINAGSLYTASRSGAVVTIEALDGLGAAANGRALSIQVTGDVTVGSVQDMTGGADATEGTPPIWTVTVNAYAATDTYALQVASMDTGPRDPQNFLIEGLSSAMPTAVKTLQQKMYAVTGSLVYFSGFRGGYEGANQTPALPDPTAWQNFDDETNEYVIGAGILNLSEQSPYSETGVGLGVYQGRLAVFSENSVQLWVVDPDPDQNAIYQVLFNIGCVAPGSIVEYGDTDTFFLSETGLRSLRARDSSNLASTTDVGDPIDVELTRYMRTLRRDEVYQAKAIIEPREGRYLLALGSRVYVFSNFPGSRVSAWTRYDMGVRVAYWAVAQGTLFFRTVDTDEPGGAAKLYQYGGEDGETYDASPVTVELPFLEAGNPAGRKKLTGIDLGVEGTWEVEFASEPNDPDARELIGTVTESTYGSFQQVRANALSTHFSLYLTNEDEGPAVLANAILHYDDIKAD